MSAGSMAADPDRLEIIKAVAFINATELDDAGKMAASECFESCMAANDSLPFTLLSFRGNDMPDFLQDLVGAIQRGFDFGQSPPSRAIKAIDCFYTTIFQNNCGPTLQETITYLIDITPVPKNYDNDINQCIDDDIHWISDICSKVGEHRSRAPEVDCIKGSPDDDGCRAIRLQLLNEGHAECFMNLTRSSDDVMRFKEIFIGGSKLGSENKAAAAVSFDQCMAKDFTPPHLPFQFELEKIPGSPLLQNITLLVNGIYAMGNLVPSVELRAVDCGFSALALNGCGAALSDSILLGIVNILTYILESMSSI